MLGRQEIMYSKSRVSAPHISMSFDSIEDLTTDELVYCVTELQEEIKKLDIENQIFENFLMNNEPSMIADMDSILERAQQVTMDVPVTFNSADTSDGTGTVTFDSMKTSVARNTSYLPASKGPRINFTLKMDLVMREIEDIQVSYEKFISKSKKIKFILRAEIEELEIRNSEVKDSMRAFERAVVTMDSANTITLKIPAEKYARYMYDWLKAAVTILEKLRLRTISYKIQLAKLRAQYATKQELGESVDEVDLEQMEIQKTHMLAEINQKNKNLIELKQINAKASLVLVNYKKILEKQELKVDKTRVETEEIQRAIEALAAEADRTEKEIETEKAKSTELREIIEKYTIPPILDYIKAKAELAALQKELKVYKRRISVQNVGLKTFTKIMCQLTGKKPKAAWYSCEYINTAAADKIVDWEDADTKSSETDVK